MNTTHIPKMGMPDVKTSEQAASDEIMASVASAAMPDAIPAVLVPATELDAILRQSIAELDRGLSVLDRELRAGQFSTARGTLRSVRALVELQDRILSRVTRVSAQ